MRQLGPRAAIVESFTRRGVGAWVLFALLLTFYVVLYFGYDVYEPSTLFEKFQQTTYQLATRHLDAFGANYMSFGAAPGEGHHYIGSRWTVYGALYTFAILAGGAFVWRRYRHNPYQVVRTIVVMFVQLSFAFSIPILLKFFGNPEFYFSYLWPLKIDYLDPRSFGYLGETKVAGIEIFVVWSFIGSLLLVPIMTLLFGKRWYCSWVCGCGGLANTFGEPWRQLSSKSSLSWKIERVTVHTVLVVAILGTLVWFASAAFPQNATLLKLGDGFRTWYGWIVVAILSGALGTALYPIGGTRVWCRFFCPMAALLGLIQKLGRFRIRVKRDMCISCGLCSTNCEMGIDVRAYAQSNQSFTRAACVGCGLCAEVCPRGVLRLENAPWKESGILTVGSLIAGSR